MGITATPTNVPDWDALQIEPACPLCEYSLRGLTDPRCPECGRRFEWSDLTDPSRRKHPYLFEHHPQRNVWSLMRTLVGGLRPGRFWRSLSPVQPSRPGRLAVYFVLAVLPLVLAHGAEWMRVSFERWREMRSSVGVWGTNAPKPPSFWEVARVYTLEPDYARHYYSSYSPYALAQGPQPAIWSLGNPLLYAATFLLIWPILTFLALKIFSQSMRRAKVRSIHVARCLVYSHDVTFWFGWGYVMLAGLSLVLAPVTRLFSELRNGPITHMAWAAVAVVWYRLWQAYRLYMRFDHAGATILATQVIVFLAMFTGLVAFAGVK